MSRNRDDSGRFAEKASLDDVLSILDERDEPMTGTEIGTTLGISNRTALDKLNRLHERGTIERKKVGGRSVVWWLTDDGDDGGIHEHDESAEALRGLGEVLDDTEAGAARIRERSREVRSLIDDEVERTRRDLVDRERE